MKDDDGNMAVWVAAGIAGIYLLSKTAAGEPTPCSAQLIQWGVT